MTISSNSRPEDGDMQTIAMTQHSVDGDGEYADYAKEAELINGRLAMLGLVIGTINYGLFGWIAPGLF